MRILSLKSTLVFSALVALLATPSYAQFHWGGIFGSRELEITNPNDPDGGNYDMLLHDADDPAVYDELEYSPERGYGFEVLDPDIEGDDRFGPFDNSPNGRGNFDLDDELYNSFIGFKNFAAECNEAVVGDRDAPCSTEIDADGGIFRVDVPNGLYRFVAVLGDSDHPHAHRLLAENGGSGGPADIGENFVTLVGNHNQADYFHGTGDVARFGSGVFARVGFDDTLPPAPVGDAEGSLPAFVDYGPNGEPLTECTSPLADGDPDEFQWKEQLIARHDGEEYSVPDVTCTSPGPDSPVLEVTEGYIRFHILQGNSNKPLESDDGNALIFTPEDVEVNLDEDRNGGDVVLLEVHQVTGGGLLGDYDNSGALDVADLNLQAAGIQAGDAAFDLNGDGESNVADRKQWVKELRGTWIGDADLNGEFNSGDLVKVFQAGLFESGQAATWDQGDFDGDGFFGSGDFVAAFQDGGFEKGPLAASSVPEPCSLVLFAIGLLAITRRRK